MLKVSVCSYVLQVIHYYMVDANMAVLEVERAQKEKNFSYNLRSDNFVGACCMYCKTQLWAMNNI